MILRRTKKQHPNYGEHRTTKVFALWPRWLDYGHERYLVWLEYFYQDEHYRYDNWSYSEGWHIDSAYPALPGVEPTYTKEPM